MSHGFWAFTPNPSAPVPRQKEKHTSYNTVYGVTPSTSSGFTQIATQRQTYRNVV